jgi:hypothetical protein
MFSKDKKNYLKEKLVCSLFKKDSDYDSESTKNQINEQANNPIHSFNERKNKEQTNVVFSNAKENDLSNHKKMRKPSKLQPSTNHWFSTNQTHSETEVKENGFAKKSQEMKVKPQMTRKALKP